jgi:hypothetical protein
MHIEIQREGKTIYPANDVERAGDSMPKYQIKALIKSI